MGRISEAMSYRVIQWATGGVGRAAIEGVLEHPDLELVGCWVHLRGQRRSRRRPDPRTWPVGVTATRDMDSLLALDADCVVYSPILADRADVVRILGSGKNVVTPGLVLLGGEDVADVEGACREGGVTLHGTGIHPGGITERFPLMVSALSSGITRVRAEEFSDIRTYDARCRAGRDAVRRHPGRGEDQRDGDGPRPGLRPIGADDGRHPGHAHRPRAAHNPGGCGGHRADRLPDRSNPARTGRGPAVPLGGSGRRHRGADRGGELVHGRAAPRPGVVLRNGGRAIRGGDRR